MPAGTFMRTIQQRGRLIAGVDQNSLLLGYLNPFDDEIEGFDIAMLHEVARAIFGDPNAIEFKAISSAERVPAVQSQSVDIVADAMTINCERARQVAFTTVYFEAGQRILVPSNSPVRSVRDLAGRRVCATESSTSLENIRRLAPQAHPYPVPLRTDCLVALQEGKVEAISTDDSILDGFRAQDPYTKIVGGPISTEPYGMAINKGHPEFVRFVNGVLQQMRTDGRWEAAYRRWLGSVTGAPALGPPQPRYRG
jgi:polar amino acid transport system substrate-binding protein